MHLCEYASVLLNTQVENLTAGNFYEFKVQAGNMAGVGLASEPSVPFACEAWTMPEPGEYPWPVQSEYGQTYPHIESN